MKYFLSALVAINAFCFAEKTNDLEKVDVKSPALQERQSIGYEEALHRLKDGNKRYIMDTSICEKRTMARRAEVSSKQSPFAAILGCSDSRVPLEIVFDQGIGNLFVVRVAGNVAGRTEIESLEYATNHLGVPLVVVIGHENCGAVSAIYKNQDEDIPALASLIKPALKNPQPNMKISLEEAIKANVRLGVETLKNSDLKKLITENKLKIVGAYYHLSSGQVEWLD